MNIKILGTGCPKCKQLEENVKKAIEELRAEATIDKVSDVARIIGYGVMSTPAIIIDGELRAHGRIPTVEEIKKWLN